MQELQNITIGSAFIIVLITCLLQLFIFLGMMFIFNKLPKSDFFLFIRIFLVGVVSSLIPFLQFSLFFGLPAVLTSSLILTLILRKEVK